MGGLQWVLDSPTIRSASEENTNAPGTKYVRTAADKAASSSSVAAAESASRAAEAGGDDESDDGDGSGSGPGPTSSFVNPAAASLAKQVGLARINGAGNDFRAPMTAALVLVAGIGAGLALI